VQDPLDGGAWQAGLLLRQAHRRGPVAMLGELLAQDLLDAHGSTSHTAHRNVDPSNHPSGEDDSTMAFTAAAAPSGVAWTPTTRPAAVMT